MINKRTYYHVVLDKSGSMQSCWNSALNMLAEQVRDISMIKQQYPEQEIFYSYCIFNQALQFSQEPIPIEKGIPQLHIFPEGSTALYDAIGTSIDYLQRKVGQQISDRSADVVMLIVTDGYENASQNFQPHEIQKNMDYLEKQEGWHFLFLGLDVNIEDVMQDFGRQGKNMSAMNKAHMASEMCFVNEEIFTYFKMKAMNQKKESFFKK
jgi:hypothetical protein